MTGCEEMSVLMQRELDRDLSGPERGRLLDHLQQCPDCAALFERLKALSTELEQLPDVLPPINIVDSILPQLAKLAPAPEAAAIVTTDRPSRKEAPWFSWKLASGVAAAAMLVAVFLFNTGKPKMDSAADETAKSADMIRPQAAAGSAKMGAPSVNESAPQSSPQGVVGTDAQKREMAFDRNNTNNSQSSVPAPPPPAAVTTPAAPSAAPASDKAKGTASVPAASETPATVQSNPDTMKQAPAEPVSESPAAVADRAPHALTAPTQAPTPQPTPAQMRGDQPVAMAQPTASPGDMAGITSFAAPAATPSPTTTPQETPPAVQEKSIRPPMGGMPSPGGDKTAVLADGHVLITDKSGNPVFKSELIWQPTDRLTFDWRSATSLAYTVVRADDSRIVYVIDLEARTEKTELNGTSTH